MRKLFITLQWQFFWDNENCAVPKGAQVASVSRNIKEALSLNPCVDLDSVTIKAYGVSSKMKEGLERTGVTLVDIGNKRKDAADKLILVDMLLFACDNPKASFLLISGDGDFAPAVHGLVNRGFTFGIAIPSVDTASPALTSAGTYVWDWPSLARGEGIVVPKFLPDNLELLKAQMIQLFESNGGHIELSRVPSLYKKCFGKLLRLKDYGAPKLIDLFEKLGKPFVVFGRKLIFLQMETGVSQEFEVPSSLVNDSVLRSQESGAPLMDKFVEDCPNELSFIGKNLSKES